MRTALLLLTLVAPALLAGCTELADTAQGTLDEAKRQLEDVRKTLAETKAELEDTKARYALLRGAKVLATEDGTVALNVTFSENGLLLVEPNVTTRTGAVPAANVTRIQATLLLAHVGDAPRDELSGWIGCEVLACEAAAPSDGYLAFRLDESGSDAYRVAKDGPVERWDGSAWAAVPEGPVTLSFEAPVQYHMAASDFADRVGE